MLPENINFMKAKDLAALLMEHPELEVIVECGIDGVCTRGLTFTDILESSTEIRVEQQSRSMANSMLVITAIKIARFKHGLGETRSAVL